MKKLDPVQFVKHLMNTDNALSFGVRGKGIYNNRFHLGPRHIDDHLLYYLEFGKISGRVSGKEIIIPKEQLFWLPPKLTHEFYLHTDFSSFKVNYIRFRTEAIVYKDPFLFQKHAGLLPYVSDCLHDDPVLGEYQEIYSRLQLCRLFSHIFSINNRKQGFHSAFSHHQRNVLMQFLLDNLNRKVSQREAAEIVELNPDYFSRRFTASFGIPFQTWMKRERIRHSASLLSESMMTISEVAYQMGYIDIYFFSRQFKDVMGESPSYWRKNSS